MNIDNLFLWGLMATMILTIVLAVSKPFGFTRMDLPFLLGTMFTSDRNKVPWYGFMAHVIIGWAFAMLYGAVFESSGLNTWWFGLIAGFIHAVFVLSVGLQLLNSFHPRVANPFYGPTPTRQLQPPGFFALNYGRGTPIVTVCAHMLYGMLLGAFYH